MVAYLQYNKVKVKTPKLQAFPLYIVILILKITRITFLTLYSVFNSARRGTDQLSLLMVTEHVILFKIEHLLFTYRNNGNSMKKTKC